MGLGQQTSVGIMSISEEEEIAALRAEKETMRRETDVLKAKLEEAKRQLKRSKSETMDRPMLPRLERPQQLAPTAAPAVEVTSDTSVFPAASSKAVAEAPTSSTGAASTSVPAAAPATGGTVPSAASGGAPASSAVAAAAVESAAWAARKPASATGSTGDRWVANICGESGASTHPFDPSTVFPPEVRYSTHGNISSSNSRGNSSSYSSNDTTSNHDSWWEATYVGALLRPFDPGKGCQRDARIGAILGVDLPFD